MLNPYRMHFVVTDRNNLLRTDYDYNDCYNSAVRLEHNSRKDPNRTYMIPLDDNYRYFDDHKDYVVHDNVVLRSRDTHYCCEVVVVVVDYYRGGVVVGVVDVVGTTACYYTAWRIAVDIRTTTLVTLHWK